MILIKYKLFFFFSKYYSQSRIIFLFYLFFTLLKRHRPVVASDASIGFLKIVRDLRVE